MNSIKKKARPRKKTKTKELDDYTINKLSELLGLHTQPDIKCYLPILLSKKVTTEQIKQASKAVMNRYLFELEVMKQRALSDVQWADLGLVFARRYGINLAGVNEPKYNDIEIEGHPAIEVYDIDPKIRQLAYVHAEHIYQIAKRKGYAEYMPSTKELRFVGMLGGWAYAVSIYKSTALALKNTSFGGPDDCDVELDGKRFDVKTNRSKNYQLNVNKRQFEKPRDKPFTAYIAAKIPVDSKLKIDELIKRSDRVQILGYAKPDKIQWVFDNYKVGRQYCNDNYGVLPTNGNHLNPWCYINIKKLGDVNKFVNEAIDNLFKDKYTGESVDPRRDQGNDT